jgi:hypothetical protein
MGTLVFIGYENVHMQVLHREALRLNPDDG